MLHTYYSVAALNFVAFAAFFTVFLFSVPRKSRATWNLAIAFLFYTSMGVAYFFSAAYDDPTLAFHRWQTVLGTFFGCLFLALFFLSFPKPVRGWIYWLFLGIGSVLSILLTANFAWQTLESERIFHFEGHYWDFAAEKASLFVAIWILGYIILYTIPAVYRMIREKGLARIGVIGTFAGFVIAVIVPALANALSRDGAIDRGVFQTLWVLLGVLGLFWILIVFVSTSGEKTNLLSRIFAISLATTLLAIQAISYPVFQEKEKDFDKIYYERAQRILSEEDQRPPELLYISHYDSGSRNISIDFTALDERPVQSAWGQEYLNAAFRRSLLEAKDREGFLRRAYLEEFQKGYMALLMRQPERPLDELWSATVTDRAYFKSKIRKLPDEDFRAKVLPLLAKDQGAIEPLASVIEQSVQRSKLEGAELKELALSYLTPMYGKGERIYRRLDNGQRVIAYLVYRAGGIHEVAFDYLSYRHFMHPRANSFIIVILSILAVVIIGYPLFFYTALLKPLHSLLSGVRRVNEGDLDVELRVGVEDELGFLARSFNDMVRSIRGARKELRDYADKLEEKVQERTKELEETLKSVRELKHQQDGDYFLTSLLIKPLGTNTVPEGPVSVDFILKQKKAFEFKHWKERIGGDLCGAHRIYLQGRPFTFFFNVDAMGKSMQGASGALVLGSVMESIIERTRMSPVERDRFPEKWLKNTFIELHTVFESFEGSMLISGIFGLVDEGSGLVYFINAEHPTAVLYRNKGASFVEEKNYYRKLGTTGVEGGIHLETLQLQAGDVLFVGSDGKDDIVLGEKDGHRIINEDETKFLKHVEKGEGDLEAIFHLIQNTGELMDDFSLLRLGYREEDWPAKAAVLSGENKEKYLKARDLEQSGDLQGALELLETVASDAPDLDPLYRKMASLATRLGQYWKAAIYSERYALLRPEDEEMIFASASFYRKAGEFEKAADFAERLRLRKPEDPHVHLFLADIYMRLKNLGRAQRMLETAERLDPGGERNEKIREKLQELKASAG
ncbi:MAG: SpoIIE family protein phosphatase [Leptospiraceae bacterium]|nr:SpoIIE family protein phosphatase [Leptospiraceae bacterium]